MNFTTFVEKLFEEELSRFTKLQPKGKEGIFYYMDEAKSLQKKFEKDRFFVVRNPKLAASYLIQFRVRIAGFKKYGIENGYFDASADMDELERKLIWLKDEQTEEAQRYYIWDTVYLEKKESINEYLALLAFESPKEAERERILFYQVCETDDGADSYYRRVDSGKLYDLLLEQFYDKGDNYDMLEEDHDDEDHDYLWSSNDTEEMDFEEETKTVEEDDDVFDDEEDDGDDNEENDEEEFEYETVSYDEDEAETNKLTTISMKNKETGENELFYLLGYFRTKPVEGGNEDHDYIAVTPNHPFEEENIEVAFFEVRNMHENGNKVEFIGVSEEQMVVLFKAFKESCEAQINQEEDDFEDDEWENDGEDEE